MADLELGKAIVTVQRETGVRSNRFEQVPASRRQLFGLSGIQPMPQRPTDRGGLPTRLHAGKDQKGNTHAFVSIGSGRSSFFHLYEDVSGWTP
jgi:hypothetical protein